MTLKLEEGGGGVNIRVLWDSGFCHQIRGWAFIGIWRFIKINTVYALFHDMTMKNYEKGIFQRNVFQKTTIPPGADPESLSERK